jgi:hypothetical protein
MSDVSRIKCSCGEEAMLIDVSHTCSKCHNNGFCVDPDVMAELDTDEDYIYYDEELRLKAEERMGQEVVRTEAEDHGECKMGSNWNAGCSLYTCSKCGKLVDFVSFVDGC